MGQISLAKSETTTRLKMELYMHCQSTLTSIVIVLLLSGCATQRMEASTETPLQKRLVQDSGRSVAELKELVAADDIKAHIELAARYGLGDGVDQDYEKAGALLKVAVGKGNPEAAYHLGALYMNGLGVPEDKTQAALLFERAAEMHYEPASYWLGHMIAFGVGGFSPSWAGAIPYLWDAAVQNFTMAEFLLGYAYDAADTDVDRNPKAAAYWYRRAFHNEFHAQAIHNLRMLVDNGEVAWQPGDPGKPPEKTMSAEKAEGAASDDTPLDSK